MEQSLYEVVFSGEVEETTTVAEVKDKLASLYKLNPSLIEKFFCGTEVKIKSGVDYSTATKFQTAFRQAGAVCKVRPCDNGKPSAEGDQAGKQSQPRGRLITDLPATPNIARVVMSKASDPDTTVKELQRIVAGDQKIAAGILKIANSSFYAGNRTVANLNDAIVLLGFKTIRNLVLTSSMRALSKSHGFVENLLWEHSVGCAFAAQAIARKLKFSKYEEAFLAGLLHDIGKVVINLEAPEKMTEIIQHVYNDSEASFIELERAEFGCDHAEIGREIANTWRFPEETEEAIYNHHEPERSKILPQLSYIIHLANGICHKLEIGPIKNPDLEVSELISAQYLKLTPEVIDGLLETIQTSFNSERDTLMAV